MGIGSVTSTNNMAGMRMLSAVSTDPTINNIENEISNAKQQMQKLSPKEELSVNEKEIERKKLQREISGLNAELKQHQEALRKSQNRDIRIAELQKDQESAKEKKSEDKAQTSKPSLDQAEEKSQETHGQQAGRPGTVLVNNSDGTVIFKGSMEQPKEPGVDPEGKQADEAKEKDAAEKEAKSIDDNTAKDAGLPSKKIYAIVSADSSVRQANRQGTVIARTSDGIAILKGEINQDEKRGVDTEKKQAELEKMEKKEQRAISFQSSILGEANNTMKSATGNNVTGINEKARVIANNNAFINALKVSQEETRIAQQGVQFSFG